MTNIKELKKIEICLNEKNRQKRLIYPKDLVISQDGLTLGG